MPRASAYPVSKEKSIMADLVEYGVNIYSESGELLDQILCDTKKDADLIAATVIMDGGFHSVKIVCWNYGPEENFTDEKLASTPVIEILPSSDTVN